MCLGTAAYSVPFIPIFSIFLLLPFFVASFSFSLSFPSWFPVLLSFLLAFFLPLFLSSSFLWFLLLRLLVFTCYSDSSYIVSDILQDLIGQNSKRVATCIIMEDLVLDKGFPFDSWYIFLWLVMRTCLLMLHLFIPIVCQSTPTLDHVWHHLLPTFLDQTPQNLFYICRSNNCRCPNPNILNTSDRNLRKSNTIFFRPDQNNLQQTNSTLFYL